MTTPVRIPLVGTECAACGIPAHHMEIGVALRRIFHNLRKPPCILLNPPKPPVINPIGVTS